MQFRFERRKFRRSFLAGVMIIVLTAVSMPVNAATGVERAAASGTISHVAATAKPSVVGILTTMKAVRSTDRGRAAGTGWVFKDGLIITNAHVVHQAAEVRILYDDRTVETVTPDKIFADETSDIAIIKVTKKGLTPLPHGKTDEAMVGQTVIAVGNPLGFRLGNSVTAGILSGTGRALGSGYPFLQTDAPINPGNSGGPLFNLKGEVIGVNSAKMADIGVEGLGFAIPIDVAVEIAELLLKDGKVERAITGIILEEGWEAYFGVPDTEGVTIAWIIPDGPAGLTALRPGDRLVRIDDAPIYTTDDVSAYLRKKRPDETVIISVKRQGQVLNVPIVLDSQDRLRKLAEEEGIEVGGILVDLTDGQVQEAADFGRSLAFGARINNDYFAISGSNYAILYTEYLYIARRVASAYQFGFRPGIGFNQSVAKEINNRLEVQMEINGDSKDFLTDATFTIQQGTRVRNGSLLQRPTYTTSPDGKVIIADLAVRFNSVDLSTTEAIALVVKTKAGSTITFNFTIKDLR